ncbi:MAG: hypothetical protein ACP5O0_09180 [Acidimicrobiales bacterium]
MTSITKRPTDPRVARALAEVLGTPARIVGFLVTSSVITLFYTLLLPFDYTQRFGLSNWEYLNAYLLIWSIALGSALALLLAIQLYAMRRITAARATTGAAGGLAFLASLLPSFLCCTPIIPSLLAFVGLSGLGLYSTTGALQHFFAAHQTGFLSASLALLAAMSWWGLYKVARSQCFSDDGCVLDDSHGDRSIKVASNRSSDSAPRSGIRGDVTSTTEDRDAAGGSGSQEGARL